jgi:glycosyltransferase involved in cell wall biosynthesis
MKEVSKQTPRDATEPLISVALCTFNGESFLEQQLVSILGQNYRNLDIVIVDDCSRDGTPQLLAQFAASDARIRLFRNEQNIGFIRNFERALRECRGEFIALADQDDIWLPHKLRTQIDEIGDNLLTYSRVELIDVEGQAIDSRFPRVNRLDGACALSLLINNCVTGHACLIHRSLLDTALPFPGGLSAHDQWLAIAAAAEGRIKASQHVLSQYRMHESNAILKKRGTQRRGSISIKAAEKLDRQINLCESVLARQLLRAEEHELLTTFTRLLATNRHCLYNKALSHFLRNTGDHFLRLYKNQTRARRKLCRGIRLYRLQEKLNKLRPFRNKRSVR